MTRRLSVGSSLLVVSLCGSLLTACGDDSGSSKNEDSRPDDGQTGAVCEAAADCFPDVPEGELAGDAICLDRVDEGYCTHECTADDDCCAADGECDADVNQVCSPFESTGQMVCFLSCEKEDVQAAQANWDAPPEDDAEYCQRGAGYDFICRSSGGGSNNRKVCVPGDCGLGADCVEDADCTGDLTCVDNYRGGYCAETGCSTDADCPNDSVCVDDGGAEPLCMRTCNSQADCSFCRADGVLGSCIEDVTTVDDATAAVCIPEKR